MQQQHTGWVKKGLMTLIFLHGSCVKMKNWKQEYKYHGNKSFHGFIQKEYYF